MANKKIHIIGGGTSFHLRPHLALSSNAYGTTARQLADLFRSHVLGQSLDTELHLTKMASSGESDLETNDDIARLLDGLTADPATKIIVLNAAMCDFEGCIEQIDDMFKNAGKYGDRLKSRLVDDLRIHLTPAQKIVNTIRAKRKDIFAVAFKATCGDTREAQYIAGLNLLKEAGVNLVLANDTKTRTNMVITPEESKYSVTQDRAAALKELVDIALHRSTLTFTRSKVVDGDLIPWDSPLVPDSLRQVVDHCIERGAYKSFRGATVGHFAFKIDDTTFVSSIRKTNFNDLARVGMVKVITDGPDSVIAYGAKPSVGGQSQRKIFHDHQQYDCIVHFHCPKLPGSDVPEVSQREYECGSHQCGENTSRGLKRYDEFDLSAVFLQEHGPNIVFKKTADPKKVNAFIDANFNLDEKTGGYVSLGQILKTPDALDTLVALGNASPELIKAIQEGAGEFMKATGMK